MTSTRGYLAYMNFILPRIRSELPRFTSGIARFAQLHSANSLPGVILGKFHSVKKVSTKLSLLSVLSGLKQKKTEKLQKNGGGPHRPALACLHRSRKSRHFSRKIRVLRGRLDLNP
jgi:hypothetical protein